MEFCGNCGKEVSRLNEYTGWCIDCSLACEQCGRPLENGRPYCNSCTRKKWLEDNADAIDDLRAVGYSLSVARRMIYDNNRPTCIVCEKSVPHARAEIKFCNRNKQCRSARRRYRTLRQSSTRLPPPVAVEQVLRELGKL